MPYANNQGTRIYYEVEGDGPPLVLLHGRTGDLQGWREVGYVEALKDNYRLILVDARGHGRSDKPYDPQDYKMALWVADIVAVLDDLGIDKAHFMGYSRGGRVGWGIAKYAPQRLSSLVIGGMDAYEADPDGPNPREQSIQLYRQGMEAFVAAMKSAFGPWWTPAAEAVIRGNDLEALIALCTLRERVGLVDALPSLAVPCLIFLGENDGHYSNAKKESKLIPNATFVSLPGLGHVDAMCRSDLGSLTSASSWRRQGRAEGTHFRGRISSRTCNLSCGQVHPFASQCVRQPNPHPARLSNGCSFSASTGTSEVTLILHRSYQKEGIA